MNSTTEVRPKRGRPVSGKKPFLVRMPPSAFVAMQQIANDNGLRVGDWLALLHVLDYGAVDDDDAARGEIHAERKRFLVLAKETARLLAMLFEVVDSDPSVADDRSVARALSKLNAKQKKLIGFVKRECP